jgi:hypothetical protein
VPIKGSVPLEAPTSAGAGFRASVPTNSERRALLFALLVGRGIERALAPSGADRADRDEDVLAAIAAASGLGPSDRLVVPRSLTAAHLATGADPAAVATARAGSAAPGVGITPRAFGSESAGGLALGTALALHQAGDDGVAVVILERRWAESEGCRKVVSIAAERGLRLAIVVLDRDHGRSEAIAAIDRRNLEAVRTAVREALGAARDQDGPLTVVCGSPAEDADARRRSRFRSEPLDPVTVYERRLMINGFKRVTLADVRAEAAAALERALASAAPAFRRAAA